MPTNVMLGAVATDFNGDSNPDFAVSFALSGIINVALGNGAGGFTSNSTYETSVNSSDVFGLASGQISGSAHPELVVGSFSSGGVRVMANNGAGVFAPSSFFNAGSSVTGVAVGDLNGDGNNDIVASRYGASSVIVFYLNNVGNLLTSAAYSTGSNPEQVVISDFNNDGRNDIATANGSGSVSVLLNGGGSTVANFATVSIVSSGNSYGIHAADFSGDGLPDLAVSNQSGSIHYLRNTGAGVFVSEQFIGSPSNNWGVTSLDFDRDGAQDIAVVNWNNGSLRVYRNVGGASPFLLDSSFSIGSRFALVTADFNKDGRTDLMASGYETSVATVLLSTTNVAPTNISLSSGMIAENQAIGATVGSLSAADPNTLDAQTFSLVSGAGSTDNSQFTIAGNSLRTAAVFDYETKNSYSVRVKTVDPYGGTFEKVLTINVADLNEAPTNITLTNSTIAENAGIDAIIGVLSATDLDQVDDFTLSLPVGLTDNEAFNINGTSLQANANFDFETKNSYVITVRATDLGSLTFDQQFTIIVTDVNEAPTVVNLQSVIATLPENTSTSSRIRVADISVTDDALGTNTLSLTGADAASFEIDGMQLFLKAGVILDFEAKPSFNVTVVVEDQTLRGAPQLTVDYSLTLTNVTELQGIDTQLGQTQRSYVRYLDMVFDRPDELLNLINEGRFQVTKFDIFGNSAGTVSLNQSMFTINGSTVRLDFGSQGVGGNRNSNVGDGVYVLDIDLDDDNTFEAYAGRFHRLLGDLTGDGQVNAADKNQLLARSGPLAENDVNGDGLLNLTDSSLLTRAFGRKMWWWFST